MNARLGIGLLLLVGAACPKPESPSTRRSVVQDAARPTEAPSALLQTLQDEFLRELNDGRREELAVAIGQTGDLAALPFLDRILQQDPSEPVALAATAGMRHLVSQRVARTFEARLKRGAEDPGLLLDQMERNTLIAMGHTLPHFVRRPPPVFEVNTKRSNAVRVLAFGDYGDGSIRQAKTAQAMHLYHQKSPFDLGITLGDNFYNMGMKTPTEPRWQLDWAAHYDKLGIPFYPTLGNHDWAMADSPSAEVLFTAHSRSWRMPAIRYTFVAGPVQFFAIDTTLMSHAQAEWLTRELDASRSRWKVVYGHHPPYSYGTHGDSPEVQAHLFPLLRGRAHVILSGHEHDLQHLRAVEGVSLFIAGGGGAPPRAIGRGERTLFAASENGFAVIDADETSFQLTFVDDDLNALYKATLPVSP
jgi:tartrate-resistant acid phosphatase type 5